MGFVRELIRKNARHLDVIAFTAGPETDILVGAGCVRTIRTCYLGLGFIGLAPASRRFTEKGKLRIIDETELTISAALKAALLNVPFLPIRGEGFWETDFHRVRPDLEPFQSPIGNEKLLAVPRIKPDVAVIHTLMADDRGNAIIEGQLCVDKELSRAAAYVILTTEKIVDHSFLAARKQLQIFDFNVDVVVELPFGAHPTSCFPEYTFDLRHLADYAEAGKTPEGFDEYLRRYVNISSHEDYLRLVNFSEIRVR